MRIAMVSTPFVPVPPPRYGGTELVVAELVNGLVSRGHEVVLFATGDSRAPCALRALFPVATWPPEPLCELAHAAFAAESILRDRRGFDVVHAHVPSFLQLARFLPVPVAYTLHHDREEALARFYGQAPAGVRFVGISRRQVKLHPELDFAAVVHHGLDPARYPEGRGGRYLAFLGRLSRVKGPDVAIEVARSVGLPIRLAGAPHGEDLAFFHEMIEPGSRRAGVELLGELGHERKVRLLGGALALLFPVRWDEPFGLVMIEALLCGTPVVAFAGGAVAEVIEPGVTGFVARDAREMGRLVREEVPRLARARVRRRALERFSALRMVDDYLRVYGGSEAAVTWGHA